MLSRWAIVITVVSANCYFITLWIKPSVCISTLEVASSKTNILFLLKSALARHKSCLWPTEKVYAIFVIIKSSLPSSLFTWFLRSEAVRTYQILRSLAVPKGSMFCLTVPLKIKGTWGMTEMCCLREWSPIFKAS